MKMKHGDLFDRWTILQMKARLDDDAKTELEEYEIEIRAIMKTNTWHAHGHKLLAEIAALAEANGKIWITEAALRKQYDSDTDAKENLTLEQIGARALRIREYNKIRVEAKQHIDQIFGDVPDKKVDHASQ